MNVAHDNSADDELDAAFPKGHMAYLRTHRMPRVLVVHHKGDVGTDPVFLSTTLDCMCLKFVSRGSDNMHFLGLDRDKEGQVAVTPEEVRCVVNEAAAAGRPYDLVLLPSQSDWKVFAEATYQYDAGYDSLRTLAGQPLQSDPKPGVVIMYPNAQWREASARWKAGDGITALIPDIIARGADGPFDAVIAAALGEAGIKRLELKADETSAFDAWGGNKTQFHNLDEVKAARQKLIGDFEGKRARG